MTTLEKSPTKQGRFTQSRIRTNERSRTTSAMMAWPTPNRNAWDVVYGSTNAQWLSKRHGPTTILKTVECGCKTGHVVMWLQKDRSSTHSIMIILHCNYKTQCSNEPYLYSNQRQKDVTRSTLQEFSTDIKEHLNQYGDDPPSRRILTKIVNQVTKNIPLGIDILN